MPKKETKKRPDAHKLMYPLVSRASSFSELSKAQFAELESVGGISLTPEACRALNTVADSWVSHDAAVHSPRPAEFRARLRAVLEPLEAANVAAELNGANATAFERHMFHWLFLGDIPGASDAVVQLGCLPNLIDFFKKAEQALPSDTGGKRAMDDGRFIKQLADQFEACGGRASSYATAHTEDGYAKTAFRAFVHHFYRLLPLTSRRMGVGLDDTIRAALTERRRRKKGGSPRGF